MKRIYIDYTNPSENHKDSISECIKYLCQHSLANKAYYNSKYFNWLIVKRLIALYSKLQEWGYYTEWEIGTVYQLYNYKLDVYFIKFNEDRSMIGVGSAPPDFPISRYIIPNPINL